MNNLTSITSKSTMQEQTKIFNWYLKLPMIIAVIIMALFFIWGIIDPIVFQHYFYGYRYGVMSLRSGFLCWLIWVAIGAVVSLVIYYILKIGYSYKILHICYLNKILQQLEENQPQNKN